jgi:CelD/BcsL family acetyltransferase involved in cellulose biosynthesis
MDLQIGRIDGFEDIDAEWAPLAEASANVFGTPEWLTTWWRHFGDDQELRLYTVRDEGRLVAVLPLVLWRRRSPRVLRFAGHGPSDVMGPICAPADRPVAAAALDRVLGNGDWDVLLAERLASPDLLPDTLRERELKREASPRLVISGASWDDYLAARTSNFRQQARRRERKLAKEHHISFRLAEDPNRLDADLEDLFWLHNQRWEGYSGALLERRAAFHREFAHTAFERGWLRLWLLELDGRTVAAWYGLRYAGRDLYYQAGRDPDYDRQAVGFVLMVHSVREAFHDGMDEYDFLRGGHAYKGRFTDDDTVVETWAAGRGAMGWTTMAVAPRMRALLASRLR